MQRKLRWASPIVPRKQAAYEEIVRRDRPLVQHQRRIIQAVRQPKRALHDIDEAVQSRLLKKLRLKTGIPAGEFGHQQMEIPQVAQAP
jgi:hypothetical protein